MAIRPAEQLIHKAAWLYYAHGLRQDEVAASWKHFAGLGRHVSAQGARDRHRQHLDLDPAVHRRHPGAQLEDALKLDAVWIAPENDHVVDPFDRDAVLAASVFLELVKKGDRIGVAWGRTVYTIADVMSYADLQDVTVVQLCGNLGAPYSYRPDQCTMEIARRLNAKGINFYAPLVLTTEESGARPARRAGDPRAIGEHPRTATWRCTRRHRRCRQPCRQMRCAVGRRDGRVAQSGCGRRHCRAGIDAEGKALDCSYNRRVISAELSSLRAIEKRLMVVQEDSKFEPLSRRSRAGSARISSSARGWRDGCWTMPGGGRKDFLSDEITAAGALSSRRRGIPVHNKASNRTTPR